MVKKEKAALLFVAVLAIIGNSERALSRLAHFTVFTRHSAKQRRKRSKIYVKKGTH